MGYRSLFTNEGLRVWVAVLIAALGALVAAESEADELTVIADGESRYVIVVAEDGVHSAKLSEAAELLQSLLAEATGVTLPIHPESKAPSDAPAIHLGRTQAAQRADLPVNQITGWSYLHRAVGDDLFLLGEDRAGWGKVGGFSGYAGTLKAVTAFLEQHVGVRFLLPGPMGTHVPKLDRLTVDTELNRSWSPRFEFVVGRRVSPRSGKHEYSPYAIANNFFGRYANDSNVFWTGGSHSWGDFVPRDEYIDTHPEYFGLFKGRRDVKRRNILCLTNLGAHALLLTGMKARLDEGYQMVMLGQADGYIECQCDDCQAIHPEIGEKLWITHRKLAAQMKRLRPNKQVVLLSYVWAIAPPKTFDRFPDNVVIMNNRYIPAYFRAWRRFDTPRIVYFPDWLGRWPRVPPRYAANLIRLWLENNVIGIYLGGGLDSPGASWGLNGPSYYAFGKAMADPTRNADALEREYVEASYGKAAQPMQRFFQTMHRRLEVRERFDRLATGVPDRRYRGYPFRMLPSDYLGHFFAPKILSDMRSALDRAQDLAENEKVKARLALVEGEFRLLHSVASVYHAYRAYQVNTSWGMLKILEQEVETYRRSLAWLHPDGGARDPGGYRQLRTPFGTGWPTKRRVEMRDVAPFDWDFEKIRTSGKLPEPHVPVRIRGGQSLPAYDGGRARSESTQSEQQSEDGFADPNIDAPFDQ